MKRHGSEQATAPKHNHHLATWLVTSTVTLGALFSATAYVQHEKAQQAADSARTTIAEHRFKNPLLEKVVDTHDPANDPFIAAETFLGPRDVIKLTLRLPENPAATKAMQQYAHSNAVQWEDNPTLTYATIAKNGTSGYRVISPDTSVGPILGIKHGVAPAEINLNTNDDAIGTEIALYASDEASTIADNKFTVGNQYIGAVELVSQGGHREWVAMAEQPHLPDAPPSTTE